jgi:multiple sugar transport system ATP-binding protein
MSTLELKHVSKTYDNGHCAVRDVDLRVEDGEFLVLVGPSGCGKTTLLRLIAGLEAVTVGEVLVDGEFVNNVKVRQRRIGMAFQSCALYPNMTVAENIGFPLKMDHEPVAVIARAVDDVAALLGIGCLLGERPSRLSGGQQQRVALGRAMVRRPGLFLLDEPMSNLDAKLRTELRAEIARIQRERNVTTVYITHDQVEAMAMADRVAVMNAGRIEQLGAPVDVYRSPRNIFVATFMGSPAMNVVRARVAAEGEELVFQIGSQIVPISRSLLSRRPRLTQFVGQDVAAGLRPEAFRRVVGADSPEGEMVLSVKFIEHLGGSQLVHASIDAPGVRNSGTGVVVEPNRSSTIVVHTESDPDIDLWKPLRVCIDPAAIHLFDLTTGLVIE